MFRFIIIFIALASSVLANAIVPSQVDHSVESIQQVGDGPPSMQQNFPMYPEYNPSQYKGYKEPYGLMPVSAPRPTSTSWSSTIASGLVPLGSFALTYGSRAVIFISQLFVLIVIGVILTTSMCTFTPFCSITFNGFGITKNQVKDQVKELARAYMTPENLDLMKVVMNAGVEEWENMSRQKQEERTEEKAKTLENLQRRRRR